MVHYPDHTSATHDLSVPLLVANHSSVSDDTDSPPSSSIVNLPNFDVDPLFSGFSHKETSLPVDRSPFASVAEYKQLTLLVGESPVTAIKKFQPNLSSWRF